MNKDENQIKQKIFPYLKALSYELIKNKPKNVLQFMILFLQKIGKYTTSGLTIDEKKELENLRLEVKKYRELEQYKKLIEDDDNNNNSENDENSFDDELEDDVMDLEEEKKIQLKNLNTGRTSVSAEVLGLYNKKENFIPKKIIKTLDQINRIKSKLLSSWIFSNLDKNEIKIVIDAMEEKIFNKNENIINQYENGDCLYIVEEGNLECYKKTKNSEKLIKTYSSGDSFGELALLYNCPRAATIKCQSDKCILWSLDRETFNYIVRDAANKKREKYLNFLKNIDILSTIDEYELMQICDSLKTGIFYKNDYIIKENEMGDVFYILEEGECNASKTFEPGKPPLIINNYSKPGEYFGERALISGEPRAANIQVVSDVCKVVSLDRQSFNRLLGPIKNILKRNMEKYEIYINPKEKINNKNDNSDIKSGKKICFKNQSVDTIHPDYNINNIQEEENNIQNNDDIDNNISEENTNNINIKEDNYNNIMNEESDNNIINYNSNNILNENNNDQNNNNNNYDDNNENNINDQNSNNNYDDKNSENNINNQNSFNNFEDNNNENNISDQNNNNFEDNNNENNINDQNNNNYEENENINNNNNEENHIINNNNNINKNNEEVSDNNSRVININYKKIVNEEGEVVDEKIEFRNYKLMKILYFSKWKKIIKNENKNLISNSA